MDCSFQSKVEKILGETFRSRGFQVEKEVESDDGSISTIIYGSRSMRVALYRSQREGEVNCLLGTFLANSGDLDSEHWVYLRSFLHGDDEPSLEELLAGVPDAPQSDEDQLRGIADELDRHFDRILREFSGR